MTEYPKDSVGQVVERDFRVVVGPEGWTVKSGASLPELTIRYEMYGTLSAERDNVILICSPLTADAHAAGYYSLQDKTSGWWEPLIGPGKAIDTRIYCVICSNNLGGCRGTTGPSSLNPQTGKPYGSAFPHITIDDMVKVQKALLDGLEINHLAAVIGGSMGGFMAMKWAIDYSSMLEKCIIIASSTKLSAQALGFEAVGRHVITDDPCFTNGDYYESQEAGQPVGPVLGLANARKLAHITYLSAIAMEQKHARKLYREANPSHFRTGFAVESYLDHQGQKFVDRFDANSYLHITWAMDQFDLGQEYGSLDQALKRVQCEVLNINLSTDWLFPPQQSRKISMHLLNLNKLITSVELDTPYGHDGFLLREMPDLSAVVSRFLEEDHLDSVVRHYAPPSLKALRAEHEQTHENEARQTFRNREDFSLVARMITSQARVLDLGCGDGSLIDALWRNRQICGVGIEKDLDGVLGCLEKDVPVVQWDLNQGLESIVSDSFDYVVLNRTLQEVREPQDLIRQIMRVGRKAIISFPNFGYWKLRSRLLMSGTMPKSGHLPYEWHNTPNIHLFTLQDFKNLCAHENLQIEELHYLGGDPWGRFLSRIGWANLGAEQVVALIGRSE